MNKTWGKTWNKIWIKNNEICVCVGGEGVCKNHKIHDDDNYHFWMIINNEIGGICKNTIKYMRGNNHEIHGSKSYFFM